MSSAFSSVQTPWLLRDRRVCCCVRNYILARKVALRRTGNPGPLDLAGWNLNHALQTVANQQSVDGVSHQMVYPCPQMPQITLTNQDTSSPAQRLDLLTACYNPIDNYPQTLLWVAHTNLVL